MITQILKDLGFGFVFVVAQVLFFQHLTVFGTMADPIIFYLLWLVSKYDRTRLLLIAAVLGLIQDAFFDFWGLFMFSKTLFVFLTFNFVKRRSENQLLLWQVFLVILFSALAHNLILVGLSIFFEVYASNYSILILVFGNAIYTAVLGALIFVLRVK